MWINDAGNPNAMRVCEQIIITTAVVDSSVAGAAAGTCFQFERLGFFVVDPDTQLGEHSRLILNRTITLREGTGKAAQDETPNGGNKQGRRYDQA